MSSINLQNEDRLKQIRISLGYSKQTAFANVLGIPLQTYTNYEKGERSIPDEVKTLLYEKFGVNLTWLLTGVGEPFLTEKKEIKHPLVEEIEKAIEKETHTRFELIESQLDLLKKQIESLRAYLPHEQGNTEIGS